MAATKQSPKTRGQQATDDTVVAQVINQAPDEQTALAMLTGSQLEGGWGPSFSVGDSGLAVGPFQEHPGYGSFQQRNDPKTATAAILNDYESAVAQVGESAFQDDPEEASERAAFLAERPAEDYYQSQGATQVHNAFSEAQSAYSGNPPSGGTDAIDVSAKGSGGGGGGSSWYDHIPILGGILHGANSTAKFFDFLLKLMYPSNLIRLGLSLLGTLLIAVGVFFISKDVS